jgi:trehalose 6-phosphate phosphatase
VVLEDKGLAVALHWRNAENREEAGRFVQELVQAVAHETGLAQEPGKYVLELRPPLNRDKGTCVAELVTELQPAVLVFVGDDRGDMAAFRAAHDAGGYALAVDHGSESPAEVLAAADATLMGTVGVEQWLRDLSGLLG